MIGERFTLALGGGGGRGWAHIGVARALDEAGLQPSLVVGTSMGAIVGAAVAAGLTPDEIELGARRTPVYRLVRRPGRYALFDPRPLLEHLSRAFGDPLIEDLPTPLAVTTYDLESGRTLAITRGPLVPALQRAIAVPLFFPPCPDGAQVMCDAGPWESVPVRPARQLAPGDPVIGVWVDQPKYEFLSWGPVAATLRRVATWLAAGTSAERLTARRYIALLTGGMAAPLVSEAPDLLIRPRLGRMPAWHFSRVGDMTRRGYSDAIETLQAAGLMRRDRATGEPGGTANAAA